MTLPAPECAGPDRLPAARAATRAYFTLDYLGHSAAALPDGGLPRWTAESRPLTKETPEVKQGWLTSRPRPEVVVDINAVKDLSFSATNAPTASPVLVIPFSDQPANAGQNSNATAANRFLDIRKIDGQTTPNEQFFFIQHYNRPEVDANSYRLKFTGLVNNPAEFSLADLKAMKSVDLVNGYECSGNSGRLFQGLSSCGRFTGVRLSQLLKQVGVNPKAREVVFFGTDRGIEDVVFREDTYKLEQQFARSITLERALKPEPLLAYALNGQPLDRDHGFPVRLIMPGWYGVANVKWLAEVHRRKNVFWATFRHAGIERCVAWGARVQKPTQGPSGWRMKSPICS